MTQEDKDLLLKDLCARLPYGVKVICSIVDYNIEENAHDGYPTHSRHPEYNGKGLLFLIDTLSNRVQIRPILEGLEYKEKVYFEQMCNNGYIPIDRCKSYLRPMSSMTEEEKKELNNIPSTKNYWIIKDDLPWAIAHYNQINWLNKRMFDYRGLIEKGLALEAKEGMYEDIGKTS